MKIMVFEKALKVFFTSSLGKLFFKKNAAMLSLVFFLLVSITEGRWGRKEIMWSTKAWEKICSVLCNIFKTEFSKS